MMDPRVIQPHHDALLGVMGQNLLEEGQALLRVLWCRMAAQNVPGFVVQDAKELGRPMFAIRGDDAWLTLQEPPMSNGLIVADHGLVLKQNAVDIPVSEFFCSSKAARNAACRTRSALAKV